jgi:hypothetical protein
MRDEAFTELSLGHKNSIATTLMLLDEALCEFEQWAQGREIKSVFYREKNELLPDQQESIMIQVARMRERLLDLKERLKLEEKPRSVANSIWSQCSMLWVNLVEVTSEHLKRYGELPVGLAEYLDPRVAELIDLTNEISRVTRKG